MAARSSRLLREFFGAGKSLCLASVISLPAVLASASALASEKLRVTFLESRPVYHKSLDFTEPSGLALSPDGAYLLSVSDDTKMIFRLGLDGTVMPDAGISTPKKGMEGIAFSRDGKTFLVVREEGNEIFEIDAMTGAVLTERSLADLAGYSELAVLFEGGPKNKGLEGISVDTASGNVFVIKEGQPRMILELSPELDRILGHRQLNAAAGFSEASGQDAELDVSGLAYDPTRRLFWIISDRGRRIFLYNHALGRATSTALLATIDGEEETVRHAEGVTISRDGRRLYVISDDRKHSRLFIYAVE